MILGIVQSTESDEDIDRLVSQLRYRGHECHIVRVGEKAEVDAYVSLSPYPMLAAGPALPTKKAKGTRWAEYREAFAVGVQKVTSKPFAAPPVRGPQDALVIALRAHARRDGKLIEGAELIAWITDKAEAWARGEEHPERFPYHRFIEWLNSAPMESKKPAPNVVDFERAPIAVPVRRVNARF